MTEHPSNVKELFEDPVWCKKIRLVITKFRTRDDVEDVFQEVFLLMFSRKDPDNLGRDYVQRWSPDGGGSFSNWIYTFVFNLCSKKATRSNTAGGRVIERALAMVQRGTNQEFPERGTIFAEEISGKLELDPDLAMSCEHIVAKLRKSSPANSWVEFTEEGYFVHNRKGEKKFVAEEVDPSLVGKTVDRDVATVFMGLLSGFEPADIAAMLKTSRQFVYLLCKDLRDRVEVKELRDSILAI